MAEYNEKLIGAIRRRGYKNYQVAEKAGIEQARFSRILTGKFTARPKEKRTLSKILRVPQKDLFLP